MFRSKSPLSVPRFALGFLTAGTLLAAAVSTSQADLIHRYSFTTDASDSVGTANGTLVHGATISGGLLQLNNSYGTASASANYLSLPANILPSSGSATIEQWFTFNGSGYYSEAFSFTNGNNDTAGPNGSSGQYLMGVISAPPGGPASTVAGGSHISQTLAGYGGGAETDAFETTVGLGYAGQGYLDDGNTYMMAVVIDGTAGTLSYYLNGLLQQTITSIPLSSYAFTNAYLGRSAFSGDGATLGAVDEFRIYNDAQSAVAVAADYAAGSNAVIATPEPASLGLLAVGGLALLNRRRRA